MKEEAVNRKNRVKDTTADRIFYAVNGVFWVIMLFIVLYPLYVVIISSFSDPSAVTRGDVIWHPVDASLVGYKAIIKYSSLWRGYANSIVYTVGGTMLSVAVTMAMAYGLTRNFVGKGVVNFIVVFTMFFSGGLIPTFLWMRDMGLYDSPALMFVMGMVSVWNLMVARTYIQTSIPNELYEAASIDGANHFQYFFKIVLPLSATIVAVLSVYYGVGKWNDYYTGLVYMKTKAIMPLQTILRQILATLTNNASDFAEMYDDMAVLEERTRIANVVKYCSIIVSTVPMVILYLLMQKYFVKGVMIGSVKG